MRASNTLVLITAILAVVAVVFLQSAKTPVVVREIPAVGVPDRLVVGMYDRVQMSVSAATARNEQAVRSCENEINMILAREFPEIERRCNIAADEVSTYGSCTTIIYRLAKEQLGWSSSTVEYVNGELRGRIQPALDVCARELNASLDRYELSLKRSTVTLASELAQLDPSHAGKPVAVNVDLQTGGDLDQTLTNLGVSAGILSIAGSFDVVAILNTKIVRSLVGKIATLAASLFAKPAATAAGSAAVAAADGPLPIGDAFAIIGGLWTGYEIYATRAAFERELKASLANTLPQMKREVHHQVMDRMHSLQAGHQQAQDQIRNQLAAHISR